VPGVIGAAMLVSTILALAPLVAHRSPGQRLSRLWPLASSYEEKIGFVLQEELRQIASLRIYDSATLSAALSFAAVSSGARPVRRRSR
jgi:hypothetical protein